MNITLSRQFTFTSTICYRKQTYDEHKVLLSTISHISIIKSYAIFHAKHSYINTGQIVQVNLSKALSFKFNI